MKRLVGASALLVMASLVLDCGATRTLALPTPTPTVNQSTSVEAPTATASTAEAQTTTATPTRIPAPSPTRLPDDPDQRCQLARSQRPGVPVFTLAPTANPTVFHFAGTQFTPGTQQTLAARPFPDRSSGEVPPDRLATTTVDANGSVDGTVTIPPYQPGCYQLYVISADKQGYPTLVASDFFVLGKPSAVPACEAMTLPSLQGDVVTIVSGQVTANGVIDVDIAPGSINDELISVGPVGSADRVRLRGTTISPAQTDSRRIEFKLPDRPDWRGECLWIRFAEISYSQSPGVFATYR